MFLILFTVCCCFIIANLLKYKLNNGTILPKPPIKDSGAWKEKFTGMSMYSKTGTSLNFGTLL